MGGTVRLAAIALPYLDVQSVSIDREVKMIIVDIGAYDGTQLAIPLAQDINNSVYAIEPVPALAEQIKAHNLPNLQVFCLTMGERDEPLHQPLPPTNPSTATNQAVSDAIPVTESRLETWMKTQSVPEIDLLKITVPGDALRVLTGAGSAIHGIKKILLETQPQAMGTDGSARDPVVEYLTRKGFRWVRSIPQANGAAETLEFARAHRYPLPHHTSAQFQVQVPYVGIFSTPQDDLVGQLLEQGIFEGPEQAFVWLYLRSGDTFWDCGAHAGLFSCIAAQRLGNQGRIVGFEPHPVCFQLYGQNLKSLGCECFTPFNIGLSDRAGSAELHLGKAGMSAFSTLADGATDHGEIGVETVRVDLRSIDDVMAELGGGPVALAKLDVEGWESFVLKGAQGTIQAHQFPVWMIEFTEENAVAAGSSTQALRSQLESFGYHICRFDATRLQLVPEPPRSFYAYDNLYAVLDLAAVNHRLAQADATHRAIAQDIINQWDRATNAYQIHPLLQACEADSAARLAVINQLSQQLQESDADRAARLQAIEQLSQQLIEVDADRVARQQIIDELAVQLQACRSQRNFLAKMIYKLTPASANPTADRPLQRLQSLFSKVMRNK
jgi:FkbM family methyltransferase